MMLKRIRSSGAGGGADGMKMAATRPAMATARSPAATMAMPCGVRMRTPPRMVPIRLARKVPACVRAVEPGLLGQSVGQEDDKRVLEEIVVERAEELGDEERQEAPAAQQRERVSGHGPGLRGANAGISSTWTSSFNRAVPQSTRR